MSEYKNYTQIDIENLLQFKNPTEIISEQIDYTKLEYVDLTAVLEFISDNMDYLKSKYEVVKTTEIADINFRISRLQLYERIAENWHEYINSAVLNFHSPHETTPENLYSKSLAVVAHREAFVFMREFEEYTPEQLKCLLQFKTPLELVADYEDLAITKESFNAILSDVCENLNKFKTNYAVIESETKEAKFDRLHSQLIETIDKEYDQYKAWLLTLEKAEIIEKSDYTVAMNDAHLYLTEYQDYTIKDLELLNNFALPLVTVADQLYEMSGEHIKLYQVLGFLKDNYELAESQEVKEIPDKTAEKPELTGMAKLCAAEREKRENPQSNSVPNKSEHKKSDLDL